MRIVVTGASGFVGGGLIARLLEPGHVVRAVVRKSSSAKFDSRASKQIIDGLSAQQDWRSIVDNQQVVIHAAARVHVMSEGANDPLSEFRKVNVEGTLNLARQSAAAGVKRFIFISSIKVNGEQTFPGKPYTASTEAAPTDPYGISKMEAEQGLLAIASSTDMEVVIIRPVLVYGPGVRANFMKLMALIHKGVPLPFGAIRNRRSFVSLDNLVDLILHCLEHPAAANRIFLVSDGENLSTTMLIQKIGKAMNRKVFLLPIPVCCLELCAVLLKKESHLRRLCGSLEVDISETNTLLGWTPPFTMDFSIDRVVQDFKSKYAVSKN
ncbi:SDR family oxidoreductase [Pseudomonas oryzihabitans]|uniref:UDP-glucose 4-epimerase family protein n=1 Tax=Pseudomonas oryzihabitans TaxID=47885 RepID=UPI002893C7A1|nr:SDR family oxidoreductase [Pseudomonas oryzihabitans]MDT3719483.1 SDR family oxidoreductase [Pseudomonas oryzihabitans]